VYVSATATKYLYSNTLIINGALLRACGGGDCGSCGGGGSLTLLVGGAQRTHPLALHTADLAQPPIAHGADLARKPDLRHLGELLQDVHLLVLLLLLVELRIVRMDGRVAGLLVVDT